MKTRTAVAFLLILTVFALAADDGPAKQEGSEAGLRTVLTAYYARMASDKPEDPVNALKSILPGKEDIEALFPKHAEKLWPMMEQYVKMMMEHVSDVAKEVKSHGTVKYVQAISVRQEDASGRYREVLAMLPEDVPVCRVVTDYEKGSAGSSSYVYVRGHWLLIRGLEGIPKFLAAPEGGAKKD